MTTINEELYTSRNLPYIERQEVAKKLKLEIKHKIIEWLKDTYGIEKPRISMSVSWYGENIYWMTVQLQTYDRKNTVSLQRTVYPIKNTQELDDQWTIKSHRIRNCAPLLEPFPEQLIDFIQRM